MDITEFHGRIAGLVKSGDLATQLIDANDVEGLAEVRYELRAEGHDDVIAALDAGTIRYAYPVVTWQGREYTGGACLIAEDPANPHDVLTPVDAVVDSFVGGQFDDLYPEVMAR